MRPFTHPAGVDFAGTRPAVDLDSKKAVVAYFSTVIDRREFGKPDPLGALGVAAQIYGGLTISASLLAALFDQVGPWAAVLAWPVVALLSARGLRGLELMVHDASHWTIARGGKLASAVNDIVAGALFAWPVMQEVPEYRRAHVVHHRDYGRAHDPCLVRRVPTLLAAAGRRGGLRWLGTLMRELPRYVVEYYKEAGARPKAVLKTLAWHACVLMISSVLLGPATAFGLWAAVFLAPFVLVLPMLRAVAEAEEHDWAAAAGGASDFASTYNNVGLIHRSVIHPFGDAYHRVHHLFGEVPTTRLKAVHQRLESDPIYRLGPSRRGILVA